MGTTVFGPGSRSICCYANSSGTTRITPSFSTSIAATAWRNRWAIPTMAKPHLPLPRNTERTVASRGPLMRVAATSKRVASKVPPLLPMAASVHLAPNQIAALLSWRRALDGASVPVRVHHPANDSAARAEVEDSVAASAAVAKRARSRTPSIVHLAARCNALVSTHNPATHIAFQDVQGKWAFAEYSIVKCPDIEAGTHLLPGFLAETQNCHLS